MELCNSWIKKNLIFQEMELFGSNIKKFFIFSLKKTFVVFRGMGPFHISGNGNPKKFLIIQEVIFRARKVKKNPLLSCFFIPKNGTFYPQA